MDAITIQAEVGRDHRLIDALPPEVPVGRVKLIIEPVEESSGVPEQPLTREEARRRWKAAGKTLFQPLIPEGATESNEAEHRRLADLFGAGPTADQIIDEERGPRE